ncbi:hypothetical protein OROGR_031106 [Orobanche gracilis]
MAGGYSDDESYGDDYSESNTREYPNNDSYAVGNYGTAYSKSMTRSGGDQVRVHQQTCRVKNEDKRTGSYERFTAKDKTVSREPFVDRSGNRGYKDEHTTSTTYKVGDKRGYTEYYREDKVKPVDYGKSSNSNKKIVGYYPKYNKY